MFSGRLLLIRVFALLVAAVIGASAGQADVVDVDASPDPLRINTGGTALITVRWDVDVLVQGSAQKIVLSSPNGRLFVDGMQVDIIGGPLSRVVTHNGGGVQNFTFRDRVRVSRTFARLIGNGAVGDYRREFNHTIYDDDNEGIVGLSPRSGGGALALRSVTILFDDKDETALAVLALLACVSHRLERGDFVNCRTCWTIETFSI